MGFFKDKTKECHRCAYVAGDFKQAYRDGICPYCGAEMVEGPRIDDAQECFRQDEVCEGFVKDDPGKAQYYQQRLAKNEEREERMARWEAEAVERAACIPKCPTCGSTNVQRISTASRLGSTLFWGLASDKIGKTMECKNCGYKW